MSTPSLFIITPAPDEPLLHAVERALQPGSGAHLSLPLLAPLFTDVVRGDSFLQQQLATLHQHFELHPPPARGVLARLRTRLAWWLLGAEMQQINTTHAAVVRMLDSLIMHLDQERAARRRLTEHLATAMMQPASSADMPALPTLPADAASTTPASHVPPPAPCHVALVWHSSFASPTGYSGSSRALVLGLDARGAVVRPLFLYGADHDEHVLMGQLHPRIQQLQALPLRLDVPQVIYAPGDRFSKNSGRYRIGFTMQEVDRLPPAWVEQANQMDEVWTPTHWGREVFRASGVSRPISTMPLGVDTERFTPAPPRTRLQEHTIFLSIFEWSERKGWDVLLRAYRAAFRPGAAVLLLLKIDCREPALNPLGELARLLPPPVPPVGVIYNQMLTAAQLVELYQAADCFVLPTHGEGWGMPVLEAMACGVPAIATAWSGITTFLTEANGYPLPIRGVVPASGANPYHRGARWAAPDEAALVDLLRHVADHAAERQCKGQQAAHDAQQWRWERSVDAICERLTHIA